MRVAVPKSGEVLNQNAGIVLLNQYGATTSQDHGKDAQALAERFSMLVIAADRPGTAHYLPKRRLARSLSTPSSYLAQMSLLGKKIDRQVEYLGIKSTLVSGRSAGGLGALALARTETLSSLDSVFVAEPVGVENLSLLRGTKRYIDYLKQAKRTVKDDSKDYFVKPLPPGLPLLPTIHRAVDMIPDALYDRYNNKKIYASDASVQYARYIAETLHQVDTTLEFAEISMVATDEVYQRDILPIAELRTTGAPFVINRPPGTVHISFDNRQYMAQIIEPTVSRTINRSNL